MAGVVRWWHVLTKEARAVNEVAMGRIAVVTDSVACVPQEFVDAYDIHVVPFQVIWDGRVYADGTAGCLPGDEAS